MHSEGNPNPSISFRRDFMKVAKAIATTPVTESTEIQSGSTGTIHKRTHTSLDGNQITYAVKQPPLSIGSQGLEDRNDLFKESVSNCQVPEIHGIMHTLGANAAGLPLFEYIPGSELFDVITQSATGLDLDRSFRITKQLATSLADLHAQGVSHGDIKPPNIIVDLKGNPVIVDLDTATRNFDPEKIVGTLDYAAPEMLKKGAPKDAKVDSFSLGCTLYSMLTKRVFYSSLSTIAGPSYKSLPKDYDINDVKKLIKSIRKLDGSIDIKKNEVVFGIPSLKVKGNPIAEKLSTVLKGCLRESPTKRLSMKQVVDILNS